LGCKIEKEVASQVNNMEVIQNEFATTTHSRVSALLKKNTSEQKEKIEEVKESVIIFLKKE